LSCARLFTYTTLFRSVMRYQLRHIRIASRLALAYRVARMNISPTDSRNTNRVPETACRLHGSRIGADEAPPELGGGAALARVSRGPAVVAGTAVRSLSGRALRSHRRGHWFEPS